MTSRNTAKRTVAQLLGEILSRDDLDFPMDFELTLDGGVEPMDIAKLAMSLEAEWGLTLHDEEVAGWRTLRDVSLHIQRLLEAGEAEATERSDEERTAWFYE